jgi:hypothetical protein
MLENFALYFCWEREESGHVEKTGSEVKGEEEW